MKKGQQAWLVRDWNRRSTVHVQKITIMSLGKVQGTARVHQADGSDRWYNMHIFPKQIGVELFPIDVDIATLAQEMAVRQRAKYIQHYADQAQHYHELGDASDRYFVSIKKDCEAVMNEAPTVIYR